VETPLGSFSDCLTDCNTMLIRFIKMILRLFGLELLITQLSKLLLNGMQGLKEEVRKVFITVMIRGLVLLVIVGFTFLSLFFGLLALAFYLNGTLENNYQGLLIVAGGCAVLTLLVILLQELRRRWH